MVYQFWINTLPQVIICLVAKQSTFIYLYSSLDLLLSTEIIATMSLIRKKKSVYYSLLKSGPGCPIKTSSVWFFTQQSSPHSSRAGLFYEWKRLCASHYITNVSIRTKRVFFFSFTLVSVGGRSIRLKTTKFWRIRRRTGTPTKTLAEDVRLPIAQDVNEFCEHAWSTTGLDASVFLLGKF